MSSATKRSAALLAFFLTLMIIAGCKADIRQAQESAAPTEITPLAEISAPPVIADDITWQEPQYTVVRPRIAYNDRYLYFDGDALITGGVLYCDADELRSGMPQVGELPQTLIYQDREYAPVRAYYESLGLTVIWDGDLSLVRVYDSAPEYGNSASKKKVTVLLYHHILKDSENVKFRDNGAVISEEAFEAQMKYLSDNGFTAITLLQLYDFLYNNRELPDKSVLITFDDGYYSNITRAYSILKKYGMTAVIFTITGRVYQSRDGGFNPDTVQYITLDDMKAHSDVFEYATHTHALHSCDENNVTLLYKADKDAIFADLNYSFFTVNNNMALAYPLGSYSDDTISALKGTPVKLAFTTESGSVKANSDPYELCRNIIWPTTKIKGFAKIVG